MTEKQYGLIPNWCIYENVDGVEKWLKLDEVVESLNELADKNEQLKKEIENGKEYCKTLETDLGNCADNRILLQKENDEIKQLIHTMLVQMEVDKINTENARYWAGIIFTFKEFEKMREIWKGDFE